MKLSKNKIPLYHQLENILRKRILKGELSADMPFPTDYQLCEEYGVSRITVRQALAILETDGLIKREQGRGTFVEHNPQRTFFYEMSGSLEKVFDFREAGTIKLTTKNQIKADGQIARDLGVAPGEDIFLFKGRQELSEDHKQAQYLEVYTPREIGKKISLKGEKRPQFYLVLEQASLETAVQFNQIIYATAANPAMASAIDIAVGSPLLVIKHIFISKNKTVLGVVIRYSPGDAYQIIHKMQLKKAKG